jgi:HK97 family phage major capsid protein
MTPEQIKALQDEMNRNFTEFKATLATQTEETKKYGHSMSDTEAKLTKLNQRFDELEIALQRSARARDTKNGKDVKNPVHTAAFNKFCRYGEKSLTPDEVKVLTISNDPTGGFGATPDEFDQEILKAVIDLSPVRSLVRVRTTGSRSFKVMKRTGTFAARRTNEVQARTETSGLTYGLEEVPTYELYAMVDIARQDLEDTGFDLEAELGTEFSEQFAVKEGAEFVTGDPGQGQFEGILTNAAVPEEVTGDANLVTYDGLVAVSHNIKAGYTSLTLSSSST